MGLATLALVGAACDRNIEPYRPGEEPSAPDLSRIFPGSSEPGSSEEGASRTARGALPPTRTEATARTALPEPASEQTSGAAAAAPIQGRIELAPELAGRQPAGGVLFVIARPEGARGGPPMAVLRIPDPSFPLEFSIGPENVMIPSMRFAGSIALSARLDADGNAMTRGADDISSPIEEPLRPGARDVRLLLSERG